MITGLEMYDALRKATLRLNGDFKIDSHDALDLMKVTAADLVLRGYSRAKAKQVADALDKANYEPLGIVLGVNLIIEAETTPELIPRTYNSKFGN